MYTGRGSQVADSVLEQYISCWKTSCHRASLNSWSNWVNSFGSGERKEPQMKQWGWVFGLPGRPFWGFMLELGYQNKREELVLERIWEKKNLGRNTGVSCFLEIDDAFWRSVVDTQLQKFGVVLSTKGRQKDLGFSIARNCTLGPESSVQRVTLWPLIPPCCICKRGKKLTTGLSILVLPSPL